MADVADTDLTRQFQRIFEQCCSSWQSAFTLLINNIEPLQKENRTLRSEIKLLQNDQSKQAKHIESIQTKLDEFKLSTNNHNTNNHNSNDGNNMNNNNNNNVNEINNERLIPATLLCDDDTLESDGLLSDNDDLQLTNDNDNDNMNTNDLPDTITETQYEREKEKEKEKEQDQAHNADDLTLMETEEEEDDIDIDINNNHNNHNNHNGSNSNSNIIQIDTTLSMKSVSPKKIPVLEVGTLAFPEDIDEDDDANQIEQTLIEDIDDIDDIDNMDDDNHDNNNNDKNNDKNIEDEEANFFAGFGVNTEPSESQAMFGVVFNENNININMNKHNDKQQVINGTIEDTYDNDNDNDDNDDNNNAVNQVESATQLIDQLSNQSINKYDTKHNEIISTQIIATQTISDSPSPAPIIQNGNDEVIEETDDERDLPTQIIPEHDNNNHNKNININISFKNNRNQGSLCLPDTQSANTNVDNKIAIKNSMKNSIKNTMKNSMKNSIKTNKKVNINNKLCQDTIIISDGENELLSGTNINNNLRIVNSNRNTNISPDVPNSLGLSSCVQYKSSLPSQCNNNNHRNHNSHNNKKKDKREINMNNNKDDKTPQLEQTELISDIDELGSTFESTISNYTSNNKTKKRKSTSSDLKFPTLIQSQKPKTLEAKEINISKKLRLSQHAGKKRKSSDNNHNINRNESNKENINPTKEEIDIEPPSKRRKTSHNILSNISNDSVDDNDSNRKLNNSNNKPLTRRKSRYHNKNNNNNNNTNNKSPGSFDDASKVVMVLQRIYVDLGKECKRLKDNNLWNNNNEQLKQFRKQYQDYILKCQRTIDKLLKHNGNNKHIANIYFMISNSICNHDQWKTKQERDKIVGQYARDGIKYNQQNYKGYCVLGWLMKENNQYSDAIAMYQQAKEFCSDSSKQTRFQREIDRISRIMTQK